MFFMHKTKKPTCRAFLACLVIVYKAPRIALHTVTTRRKQSQITQKIEKLIARMESSTVTRNKAGPRQQIYSKIPMDEVILS